MLDETVRAIRSGDADQKKAVSSKLSMQLAIRDHEPSWWIGSTLLAFLYTYDQQESEDAD